MRRWLPRLPHLVTSSLEGSPGNFVARNLFTSAQLMQGSCRSASLTLSAFSVSCQRLEIIELADCCRSRAAVILLTRRYFRVTCRRDITHVKSGVARAALVFEEGTPCARSAWSIGGFGAFVVLPRAVLPKQESDNSIQSSRAHCLFCRSFSREKEMCVTRFVRITP